MTIIIDGITADITCENEKKLGEALSGIEKWVDESGFCLSRVLVDGEDVVADSISVFFDRNIDNIKTLEIVTRPFAAFYGEALAEFIKTLDLLRKCRDQEARNALEAEYKNSPSYSFLAGHDKELLRLLWGGGIGVSGGDFSDVFLEKTLAAARTRLLEAENPVKAFLELEDKLNGSVAKLLDLPLDLQTGNDNRAACTIEDFSYAAQTMFRLLPLLRYAVLKPETEAEVFMLDEFKSVLKEFAQSYENKDVVLSGDLAEYELAPRVKEIYAALKQKLPVQELNNA
ncbi:MAG: hypothetical protein LBH18_04685 [Spirochaetaceae bacterium]|jgi:hypothetical protein|nr:hypothetical protein [Spirochaetaceae bacterium]